MNDPEGGREWLVMVLYRSGRSAVPARQLWCRRILELPARCDNEQRRDAETNGRTRGEYEREGCAWLVRTRLQLLLWQPLWGGLQTKPCQYILLVEHDHVLINFQNSSPGFAWNARTHRGCTIFLASLGQFSSWTMCSHGPPMSGPSALCKLYD